MCSLSPRAAAFLDRQRGVVAAAMAPGYHNAAEPTHRARGTEASTAPARKRGRHDGFDFEHAVADPAVSSSALRIRMDKELVALQGLLKRAKLLPRRPTPPAEKKPVPAPWRSESPVVSSSSAAKRTMASQLHPDPKAATEAADPAYQARITAAPPANSKQQQCPVQRAAAKTEVPEKRRPEEEKELARAIVVWNCAAAREEFRQMLLEMEKAALPDETVYPEEMEELGIPFEFVITRTWKQAMLDYNAKKVELQAV